MKQILPEPEWVKLALSHIDEAKERLQLASEILSPFAAAAVIPEALPVGVGDGRQLDIGEPPQDVLDIAQTIIESVLPEQLAHRALEHGASPRDWLYRVQACRLPQGASASRWRPWSSCWRRSSSVCAISCCCKPRRARGLPHKTPIRQLDLFLETFMSEMLEADRGATRFNDWLKRTVSAHYPDFDKSRRLNLPNGDHLLIPESIEPLRDPAAGPIAANALTSPIDPMSALAIPPGSGWRITLRYAAVLHNEDYPAFHLKHHSGIDVYRWNGHQTPVYAMRSGVVIDSVYLPKGFGNTVTIEHDDGTCLRYTHLDKKLVKKGERVERGQQIGTVGKGAKNIYPAHLHLDRPRSSVYARARTYYDTVAEVAERFIDPLSRIPAGV